MRKTLICFALSFFLTCTASTQAEPQRGSVWKTVRRVATCAMLLTAAVGAGVANYAYNQVTANLPDHETLKTYQPAEMTRVYTPDSRLMAELATERRIFMPYNAIPTVVQQAFISAEDQHFYTHNGIDPQAIIRALITNLNQHGQGRRMVGASTITQQVAKNILLNNEFSLSRKVREAILALRIEQSMSKERILELYLNEIYLGFHSYGVAAAAQAYFNKSLSDINLAEAAFLAALPKAPNNYNPVRYADAARARRNWVLDRMVEDRAITAEQAAAAKAAPLPDAPGYRLETVTGAEYFAEEVRRTLVDKYGADTATQGGLTVRTTVNLEFQQAADKALREGLMRYDQRRGGWRGPVERISGGPQWAHTLKHMPTPAGMLPHWQLGVVLQLSGTDAKVGVVAADESEKQIMLRAADHKWARPLIRENVFGNVPGRMSEILKVGDVIMIEAVPAQQNQPEKFLMRQVPLVQGALVSVEVATGRVVAMSGGWSYDSSVFNRATQAQRQPGSSFKPVVYLSALQAGISPSQMILDAPVVVDLGTNGVWRPGNYGLDFSGPVPLRVALEKSLNLVSVRLAMIVGMPVIAEIAKAYHVVDNLPLSLTSALGSAETTVMRQAGFYASLAAGGKEVVPTLIDSIQDRDGKVIWRAPGITCENCEGSGDTPPILKDTRRQIADPASVYQLTTMMQGVVTRGTGFAAGKGLSGPIAGKTGTSQSFNDNWFVGYTPEYATVVWVGFDEPKSLGNNETGGSNAAPIWRNYMEVVQRGRPVTQFPVPPGVTLEPWRYGSATLTDAFKPGQTPGGSEPGSGSGFAVRPYAPQMIDGQNPD